MIGRGHPLSSLSNGFKKKAREKKFEFKLNGMLKGGNHECAPKMLWESKCQRRSWVDGLCSKLGYKRKEDFYCLTREEIESHGGAALMRIFSHPINMLENLYPEHKWYFWKCKRVPPRLWEEERRLEELINWLAKELRLRSLEDWSGVSLAQLERLCGWKVHDRKSLMRVVSKFYSGRASEEGNGTNGTTLSKVVRELFPGSGDLT